MAGIVAPLTDICGHNGLHCASTVRREPPPSTLLLHIVGLAKTQCASASFCPCYVVFHPYVSVVLCSILVLLYVLFVRVCCIAFYYCCVKFCSYVPVVFLRVCCMAFYACCVVVFCLYVPLV